MVKTMIDIILPSQFTSGDVYFGVIINSLTMHFILPY